MIDINLLRENKGGNPSLVRESQFKRGGEAKSKLVDFVLQLDEKWKKVRFDLDAINRELNSLETKLKTIVKEKKKDSQEWHDALSERSKVKERKSSMELHEKDVQKDLHEALSKIGNILDPEVIVSNTEDNNKVLREWRPENVTLSSALKDLHLSDSSAVKSHHEVLLMLNGYDPNRGAKVAGHRGYFLTGVGVDLNLAILSYALDFLEKKGYKKIWTPFFMKGSLMEKTAELGDFRETLYRIDRSEEKDEKGNEDKYLIATSEQPISALHSEEWFTEPGKELPLKYAGTSTCFRKEAGAHGRDTWGIFRVHQFEKVEQFVITEPEHSKEAHEEMIKISEEFYQSLNIPYRVVSIVSGALNNAAAKKYDLEAWFPYQKEYKELVSCSNCTDYQSRELDIRCGAKKMNDQIKKYVHCLNGTLAATQRAMCCILENYQRDNGVEVPLVLREYMKGREFLEYK